MRTTHYPCVKGLIGDWTYYVTVMGFSDVVTYINFAGEVCPNKDLDFMIQRELSTRSTQIAQYLSTQEQRFFGSLIVAAYDGSPKFLPISFSDNKILPAVEDKIGLLQFDGTEQYYVVDGQHRLAALRDVLKQNKERYTKDEISVIIICHKKDAEGMARARRLFTTVNRYVKKTSKATNIAMDEDDGYALITRRLLRENTFFQNRIKILRKTNKGLQVLATGDAMGPSDISYLMALGTFYECNKNLIPDNLRHYFLSSQQTPELEMLENAFIEVDRRWSYLIEHINAWNCLHEMNNNLQDLRTRSGGHVLARPIGIASFTRAVGKVFDANLSLDVISEKAEQFKNIADEPWVGLIWNSSSNTMIAGKESENISTDIWKYMLGLEIDISELNTRWRSKVDPQNMHPERNLAELSLRGSIEQ